MGKDADNGDSAGAGGLTAVCAGWSVLGLYEGMNVQEIMNPVSYVDSEQAQRYVRQEVYSQLDNLHLKIRF